MGTLVDSSSTTGAAASSRTEAVGSFAVAGDLLLAICATNLNAGADTINLPAGYALAHGNNVATAVNVAVMSKVAAGGETGVTITTSVAQRMQTAFMMLRGYAPDVEATSVASTTSGVTAGDSGTVTPLAGGRLAVMVVVAKNSEASLTEVGGFSQITIANEGGATSTQKLTMGVYYDLNRSTAAREQPTWTTIAAAYAGLGVVFPPPPRFPDVTVVRRVWAGR